MQLKLNPWKEHTFSPEFLSYTAATARIPNHMWKSGPEVINGF